MTNYKTGWILETIGSPNHQIGLTSEKTLKILHHPAPLATAAKSAYDGTSVYVVTTGSTFTAVSIIVINPDIATASVKISIHEGATLNAQTTKKWEAPSNAQSPYSYPVNFTIASAKYLTLATNTINTTVYLSIIGYETID